MVKTRDWAVRPLRDLVRPYLTVDPKKNPRARFRYIDIGSIDNASHRIVETKEFLGQDAPSRARRVVEAGDVLFSTVRPYLKKIALVPKEMSGYLTSTGICVLRPGPELDPRFLLHAVRRDEFVEALSKSMDGSLYPAVRDSDVLDQEIPVPSLEEQRRIVSRIEEMMERSRRARGAITAAREEALKHWRLVEDIVWHSQDAPAKTAPLSSIILTLSNGIATPPREQTGQRILRISAVRPGTVDLGDVRYLPPDERWERYLLKDGDLLFVRYNGNADLTGVCAMVRGSKGDTVYPDKLIRAEVRQDIVNPEYLELALNTGAALDYIKTKRKTAAGQVGISGSDLKQVPIPLASLDVQNMVVRRCSEILQALRTVEAFCEGAASDLQCLESSILSKAFSGEL